MKRIYNLSTFIIIHTGYLVLRNVRVHRAGFRLCAITRDLDTLRSVLVQTIQEKKMQVFAVDFCAILLVCKTRIIAHPHSPPPKKNPFYLLRFFHINKEISRHFPVQWRIQRMREESQISQPTFLSRVCRISSSAL